MTPEPIEVWWKRQVGYLTEAADTVKGIAPEEAYCKNGPWPAVKLVFMNRAARVYRNIIQKSRLKGTYDGIYFIDLCSGSGLTNVKVRDTTVTLAGTALLGARVDGFDHYYFVEPRRSAFTALERRLASLPQPERYSLLRQNRADAVKDIVADIAAKSQRPHFIVFADFEGFNDLLLPELEPLFSMSRGDAIFNFQLFSAIRSPEAVARFIGDEALATEIGTISEDALYQCFTDALAKRGRPVSERLTVKAGFNGYSYEIVYAAARTGAGNPWLRTWGNEVRTRGQVSGETLEALLLGQTSIEGALARKAPKQMTLQL